MGWMRTSTSSYSPALVTIGIGLALAGLIALCMHEAMADVRPAAAVPAGRRLREFRRPDVDDRELLLDHLPALRCGPWPKAQV